MDDIRPHRAECSGLGDPKQEVANAAPEQHKGIENRAVQGTYPGLSARDPVFRRSALRATGDAGPVRVCRRSRQRPEYDDVRPPYDRAAHPFLQGSEDM